MCDWIHQILLVYTLIRQIRLQSNLSKVTTYYAEKSGCLTKVLVYQRCYEDSVLTGKRNSVSWSSILQRIRSLGSLRTLSAWNNCVPSTKDVCVGTLACYSNTHAPKSCSRQRAVVNRLIFFRDTCALVPRGFTARHSELSDFSRAL